MIKESVATYIGACVTKSSQSALQADGQSPLVVKGETRIVLTRDNHTFKFEGLVVENMDIDMLVGVPFMSMNDIAVRPTKKQVILGDDSIYNYGYDEGKTGPHSVRRTHAYVLRAPQIATTVWPAEYIELDIPSAIGEDVTLAVEPRIDSPVTHPNKEAKVWPPPTVIRSVGTKVRIMNFSDEPKILKRHEHFCQVSRVFSPTEEANPMGWYSDTKHPNISTVKSSTSSTHSFSKSVQVDPSNILPNEIRSQFKTLHAEYDEVFNPQFTGYNGAVGPFEATVNMGPVEPPQRKGRLPQYARDKLVELQDKFDSLEALGVFKRPEDLGVTVEYLNPSFLVKKPSGGFRLVTAFADVGRYSKPQPSLLPDVDSTLRTIARWKYIIVSDLTSAFYQIPLARNSMKYCGVVTPFKGVRVYTRCAMGIQRLRS